MKAFLIVNTNLLSPYSLPSPVLSITYTKMILMLYYIYPLGDRTMGEMHAINYRPMRYYSEEVIFAIMSHIEYK